MGRTWGTRCGEKRWATKTFDRESAEKSSGEKKKRGIAPEKRR
jgi:hypothetical protein